MASLFRFAATCATWGEIPLPHVIQEPRQRLKVGGVLFVPPLAYTWVRNV